MVFSNGEVLGVLPTQCLERVVVDLDVFSTEGIACFQLLLSRGLSLGILLTGGALKLPQIYDIVTAQSVLGIELDSLYLEVIAYTSAVIYNSLMKTPITTWGEIGFILIENYFLVALYWYYAAKGKSGKSKKKKTQKKRSLLQIWALCTTYLIVFGGLTRLLPPAYYGVFMGINMACALFSRVPQILGNFRRKHTGLLSSTTTFLQCIGASVRCFTTATEVTSGFLFIIIPQLVAMCMNWIMFSQILLYRSNTVQVLKTLKEN